MNYMKRIMFIFVMGDITMSVIIDIDLSIKWISKRQVNWGNPDPNISVEE